MSELLVITSDDCPKCEQLKAWFDSEGYRGEYITIDAQKILNNEHPEARDILPGLAYNDNKLPAVWWKGEVWSGDEFKELLLSGNAEAAE